MKINDKDILYKLEVDLYTVYYITIDYNAFMVEYLDGEIYMSYIGTMDDIEYICIYSTNVYYYGS